VYNALKFGTLIAASVVLVTATSPADAFGPSHQRDGFEVSRADHQRLQRDYRSLLRQSKQNLRQCSDTNAETERTYRQQLKQQSVLRSSIQDTSSRNADALNAMAQQKNLPSDFFERPTLDEHEALQGRYQALISAYRNLERDYNALQSSYQNGGQARITSDGSKNQLAASQASPELAE
jgi:hypothetical protein